MPRTFRRRRFSHDDARALAAVDFHFAAAWPAYTPFRAKMPRLVSKHTARRRRDDAVDISDGKRSFSMRLRHESGFAGCAAAADEPFQRKHTTLN